MSTAMNDLVSITEFSTIGADERGVTLGFQIPRPQSEFIFLTRSIGSLSGNTYHEGKNQGTSPKIFLFLAGKIKLSYRKIGTSQIYEVVLSQPAIIQVSPFVTHKVEVLENAYFIECNSIQDIQEDRIKEAV